MSRLKKLRLVPALLAASVLHGVALASPASAATPLTVLGDSYSIPVHDGTRDWPTQLRDQGAVGQVHDFAKSGARPAGAPPPPRAGRPPPPSSPIPPPARSGSGTPPASRSAIPWSTSAT